MYQHPPVYDNRRPVQQNMINSRPGPSLHSPGFNAPPAFPTSSYSGADLPGNRPLDSGHQADDIVLDDFNCDLYFEISNGLTGQDLHKKGFEYLWAGCRATHGIRYGKGAFEVTVLEEFKIKAPPYERSMNVTRVGWSIDTGDFQLGESLNSYGYGGTGKSSHNNNFLDYGGRYGVGDVIGCYIDLTAEKPCLFFTKLGESRIFIWINPLSRVDMKDGDGCRLGKNGAYLGVAFTIDKSGVGQTFFPHFNIKNIKFEVNFGNSPPKFPLVDGFQMIANMPIDSIRRTQFVSSKRKEDHEILMMIGLPGAGKTIWAENYGRSHRERRFYILGTNMIMEKMKVMGLNRKRNYHGRWDQLIKDATGILNEVFKLAERKVRNYILDQTNVYCTARKRKMKSFKGYKRVAIVLVNDRDELMRRTEKREKEEGKLVPESAVKEMMKNFTLPDNQLGDVFDEIRYVEADENISKQLVAGFRQEGLNYKPDGNSGKHPRSESSDRRDQRPDRRSEMPDRRDDRGDRRDNRVDRRDDRVDRRDDRVDRRDDRVDRRDDRVDRRDDRVDRRDDSSGQRNERFNRQDERSDRRGERSDRRDARPERRDMSPDHPENNVEEFQRASGGDYKDNWRFEDRIPTSFEDPARTRAVRPKRERWSSPLAQNTVPVVKTEPGYPDNRGDYSRMPPPLSKHSDTGYPNKVNRDYLAQPPSQADLPPFEVKTEPRSPPYHHSAGGYSFPEKVPKLEPAEYGSFDNNTGYMGDVNVYLNSVGGIREEAPRQAMRNSPYSNLTGVDDRRDDNPGRWAGGRENSQVGHRGNEIGHQQGIPGYQDNESRSRAGLDDRPGYRDSRTGFQDSRTGFQDSRTGFQSSMPEYRDDQLAYQERPGRNEDFKSGYQGAAGIGQYSGDSVQSRDPNQGNGDRYLDSAREHQYSAGGFQERGNTPQWQKDSGSGFPGNIQGFRGNVPSQSGYKAKPDMAREPEEIGAYQSGAGGYSDARPGMTAGLGAVQTGGYAGPGYRPDMAPPDANLGADFQRGVKREYGGHGYPGDIKREARDFGEFPNSRAFEGAPRFSMPSRGHPNFPPGRPYLARPPQGSQWAGQARFN